MSDQSSSLVIGLPAGSLADPKRGGNLVSLLENAGFTTAGYESGGPSRFTSVNFLYGWDGRPQEFGSQLDLQELDIAIAGDDWIMERQLELKYEFGMEMPLEKVLSLKRGNVKLVGIACQTEAKDAASFIQSVFEKKDLLTAVSEMPYITIDWLKKKMSLCGLDETHGHFAVQKYKTPARIRKGIVVYETWGKTESKIRNGGADIGLEITQSGSAIKNYGLTILDTVLESESGVWINPLIRKDPDKSELMNMFLINLYGCVNAENKVMILFNVRNDNVGRIESYLKDNNLFADEPTVNAGKKFTQFSIQVDRTSRSLPLAKIRYELARYGAMNIDTLPVNSSIPNLNIL